MAPKTSVVPRTDTQNNRSKLQRPASASDSQNDPKPSKEPVARTSLNLIGSRNLLALLFQKKATSDPNPVFKTPNTKPIKINQGASKPTFSPVAAAVSPAPSSSQGVPKSDSNSRKRKGSSLEGPADPATGDKPKPAKKARAAPTKDLFSPEQLLVDRNKLSDSIAQSTPVKLKPKPNKNKRKTAVKDMIEPGRAMDYGVLNDLEESSRTQKQRKNSKLPSKEMSEVPKSVKPRKRGRPAGSTRTLALNKDEPPDYAEKKHDGRVVATKTPKLPNSAKTSSIVDVKPVETPNKKRGRPPKSTQFKFVNVEVLNGKAKSAKSAKTEDKKPKIQTEAPVQESSDAPIVKRKRGRPRKNRATSSSNGSVPSSEPTNCTPKPKAQTKVAKQRLQKLPKLSYRKDSETLPRRPQHSPKRAAAETLYEDSVSLLAKSGRRTSYPERGKRILLIGNGFSAKLNPDVSASHYNRWIDQDASAPDQMRQLLIWCFRKKVDEELHESDEHKKKVLNSAKLIEKEILKELVSGSISVDWTKTEDDELQDIPLADRTIFKVNQINQSNAESVDLFTHKLQNLKIEHEQWKRAQLAAIRPLETLTVGLGKVKGRELQSYLREKPDGAARVKDILQNKLADDMDLALEETKKSVEEDLEDNTDKLLHLLHKLKQSLALTAKVEQEKLATKVSHLARAFGNRKMSASTKKDVNVRDLLRGISRIDTATSKVH